MQVIIGDRGELFYLSAVRRAVRVARRRSVLGIVADVCVAGYLVTAAAGLVGALFCVFTGVLP